MSGIGGSQQLLPGVADTLEERQQQQELIAEHFRFDPFAFTDSAVNTANELVYQAVDTIEAHLKSQNIDNDQLQRVIIYRIN